MAISQYVTVKRIGKLFFWYIQYHEGKARRGNDPKQTYQKAVRSAQAIAECAGLPYVENVELEAEHEDPSDLGAIADSVQAERPLITPERFRNSGGWGGSPDVGEYESRCPYLF